MWVATAAESRAIDRWAIEELGIPQAELMRRAAEAAFQVCRLRFPAARRVLVLAGPGNNGGDAVLLASMLSDAGDEVVLAKVLQHEASECDAAEGSFKVVDSKSLDKVGPVDLVVDGLLGTGLNRPVDGLFRETIEWMNSQTSAVLALDVPSGIDSDTGQVLGTAVRATHTVSFICAKRAAFGHGATEFGQWQVADLGIGTPFPRTSAYAPDSTDFPLQLRPGCYNKGDVGHVLVVAGSQKYTGAATLAALGSIRGGAGLVTVAAIPSVASLVRIVLPEVIVVELPEQEGVIAPAAAEIIRGLNVDSAVVGPGLGAADDFLRELFRDWTVATCLDADALNAIARGIPMPKSLFNVMTPHPGEMGRLLGISAQQVNADRFGAVQAASEKFSATVVLKGQHSLVAEWPMPGPISINTTGNPGMATGGMGDVLAGLIGAEIAMTADPLLHTAKAVYLHGLAGDLCAQEIGPVGYTASELAARIPKARAKLDQCSATAGSLDCY